MKKKLLIISICFVALFMTGCKEKHIPVLENGKEVVAEIEGKKFTADDLYAELKGKYGAGLTINFIDQFIADKEIPDNDEALEYAASQVEQTKLYYKQSGSSLESDLANSGFASIKEYESYLANNYKMNQVVEKYLTKQLTDKEIDKYYEDEIFGELTVRHILIKPDATDEMTADEKTEAENKALEEAKSLITKLNNNEAKFEDLAKEYSDDSTAKDGGLFAKFTKEGVVPEFWDASLALKDNEYTKTPVKTQYGYHVILRVSQADKPTKESVLDKIKDTLVTDKLSADANLSYKTWAAIREEYGLKLYDTDIESTYNKSIKSYK